MTDCQQCTTLKVENDNLKDQDAQVDMLIWSNAYAATYIIANKSDAKAAQTADKVLRETKSRFLI